jgi:hypothetical protein
MEHDMSKNRFGGLVLPLHVRKQLGATGKHPDGKLNEHDEGELTLAVGIVNGNVVIDFGKPIRSLAMPPENARGFAQLILDKAAMAAMPDDDTDLPDDDDTDFPDDDDNDEELIASDERDAPDEVESSDSGPETDSEPDSDD